MLEELLYRQKVLLGQISDRIRGLAKQDRSGMFKTEGSVMAYCAIGGDIFQCHHGMVAEKSITKIGSN